MPSSSRWAACLQSPAMSGPHDGGILLQLLTPHGLSIILQLVAVRHVAYSGMSFGHVTLIGEQDGPPGGLFTRTESEDPASLQVMEEGERLSKKQLAQENTIKKLRSQLEEARNEKTASSASLAAERSKVCSMQGCGPIHLFSQSQGPS